MGSRSFFYEADEVVAAGGDFGEPEMSGRVGSGCAEIGSQAFSVWSLVNVSLGQSV